MVGEQGSGDPNLPADAGPGPGPLTATHSNRPAREAMGPGSRSPQESGAGMGSLELAATSHAEAKPFSHQEELPWGRELLPSSCHEARGGWREPQTKAPQTQVAWPVDPPRLSNAINRPLNRQLS